MKTLLTISAILSFLYSCTTKPEQTKSYKLFEVTYQQLSVDTSIRRTQYHNGYYLLQLNNNNFAVLDTNFKHHKEIEELLSNTKTTYFYKRNDTTILALETKDLHTKEFYLADDFKLKLLNSKVIYDKPVFYGQVFLEDSTYQIYGCCAGEFGGSLFFYNKKNKRLYFYPAGCVDQVIFYHGSYYVFENLYNASYIRIGYPEKLIELKYNNRLFGCNWWPGIDSLEKYYRENMDSSFKGVFKYKSNWREKSLNSFTLNDTLFTIISSDSLTYLAIHQGDSLKQVQAILNKRIKFDHAEYYDEVRRRIISFSSSGTQWNSETKIAHDLSNTGFIIIRGRKIEIGEYSIDRTYIMK